MSPRIYIVEDSERLRQILTEFLANAGGFEVCGGSGSAEAALQDLPEAKADLVVIDISLPGMSGFELLQEIQKRYPQMPCVILSGHSSTSQYAQHAHAVGAKEYLEKARGYDLPLVLHRVLNSKSLRKARPPSSHPH